MMIDVLYQILLLLVESNTVHKCGWRRALRTRMGLFHKYGFSISCQPWRNYIWIPSCTILRLDQIWSHQNYTLVMEKFGCLVGLAALFCGFPGRFIYEGWSVWGGKEKKKGGFRFFILSDTWRVSLCFWSLYIGAILWNIIQYIPGLL